MPEFNQALLWSLLLGASRLLLAIFGGVLSKAGFSQGDALQFILGIVFCLYSAIGMVLNQLNAHRKIQQADQNAAISVTVLNQKTPEK